MTLRSKILGITGLTLAALIVALYTSAHLILTGGFATLEEESVRRNVQQALGALSETLAALDTKCVDWAAWDDTYAFIEDANEEYVRHNLVDETFANQRLNLMLFVHSSGRIVFAKAFDLEAEKEIPVPAGLSEHLAPDGLLLRHRPDKESKVTGIILLPEGPMLVASRPILTSEYGGPVRGTLIMGRYLDAAEIERLAATTHLSLEFRRYDDPGLPPDFRTALSSLAPASPFVRPLGEEQIAGYAPITDVYGRPALILRVDMPRDIYKQGQATKRYFALSLLAVGLVAGVMTLLLLEKMVLSPLARLNADVRRVGAGGDASARVSLAGGGELASLAGAINEMLAALEQSQQRLRESEELFKTLATSSPIGIYIVQDGKFRFVNPQFEKHTGYGRDELLGTDSLRLVLPEDRNAVRENAVKMLKGERSSPYEYRVITKGGEIRWVMETVASLRCRGERAVLGNYMDITERKRMEEELKFLSFHDPLTGLYNRAYFEQEMRRLEGGRYAPVSIIVWDVDGLKLVNDVLGHEAGDQLLVAAAGVTRKCFRSGDVVARIGGDEFAALLPRAPRPVVEDACRRIREAVAAYNAADPALPLSISVGYATGDGAARPLRDVLREADNNMYREKLLCNQSARCAILQAILRMLETKDPFAAGHASRVQELVTSLAEGIGLSEKQMADLRLLARFHDIGKAGLPDHIRSRPEESLTPDERFELERHPENGYRIALAVPELAPIADLILKHHEWWNGQGYPLGLKGEEIPLECRILAVADAYDVMTAGRPGGVALSREEAAARLQRDAGTRFDPRLVAVFLERVVGENAT